MLYIIYSTYQYTLEGLFQYHSLIFDTLDTSMLSLFINLIIFLYFLPSLKLLFHYNFGAHQSEFSLSINLIIVLSISDDR